MKDYQDQKWDLLKGAFFGEILNIKNIQNFITFARFLVKFPQKWLKIENFCKFQTLSLLKTKNQNKSFTYNRGVFPLAARRLSEFPIRDTKALQSRFF